MKKFRILLWSALITLFGTVGVSADVPSEPFFYQTDHTSVILLSIALGIILSAIGVAIWILVRAGRKK